jgi:peptidoglycan/LPS O-acetylase OafA/YrhL
MPPAAKARARAERGPDAPVVPANGEIAPLTGLRGLAAAAVLGLHAFLLAGQPELPAAPTWLLRMGWTGVDVFFVLSGFLLALPFARAALGLVPTPDRRLYARRRVMRIVPAYYVQALVLLALGIAGVAGAGAWRPAGAGEVVAHALLWINAWPLAEAHLPHWWTLPVEMGFYLLLPVLAWALAGRRWPWLLALIAASLAWRALILSAGLPRPETMLWADHLPGRIDQFVVGMLAARWFVARRPGWLSPGRAAALGLLAIAAFLALPALGWAAGTAPYTGAPSAHPLLLGWHLFAALVVAVLIVALAHGAGALGRALEVPPLRLLGVVSYSLYLWHYPVLLAVRDGLGGRDAAGADFVRFLVAGTLASLAVAVASWWLVERPAQAWAARR